MMIFPNIGWKGLAAWAADIGSDRRQSTDAFILGRLARAKDIFRYFAEYLFGCEHVTNLRFV
jgi:hypothetical protein